MSPPRNPQQISSLTDLARSDVRFINRKQGTGTRLWLDNALREANLSPEQIQGYETTAGTHLQVAQAIQEGQADAGLGILAAAQRFELDFIPLFKERYDLVLPTRLCEDALLRPLLDYLQTAVFRQQIASLDGYDPSQTGNKVPVL